MRRYRFTKLLVLLAPLLYLLVVAETEFSRRPREVFPFFNWKLFVHTPGWVKHTPGLVLHSANGSAGGDRWVIPSRTTNDMKVLVQVRSECRNRAPEDCRGEVERQLLPIVADSAEGRAAFEFSLVRGSTDLRSVRDGIRDLLGGARGAWTSSRWVPCFRAGGGIVMG